jgi:hypothetical protein
MLLYYCAVVPGDGQLRSSVFTPPPFSLSVGVDSGSFVPVEVVKNWGETLELGLMQQHVDERIRQKSGDIYIVETLANGNTTARCFLRLASYIAL